MSRPAPHPAYRPAAARFQRGMSLFVSLIFLAVLSLLAVAAMNGTTLEERMARNERDQSAALNAAETAIRDAERDINNSGRVVGNLGFTCACGPAGATQGLCLPATQASCSGGVANPAPVWTTGVLAGTARSVALGTFTGDPGFAASKAGGGAAKVGGVAAAPRYIIEALDEGGANSGTAQNNQGSPICSKKMPSCGLFHYRITAEGTGPTPGTVQDIQEAYRP